MSLMGIIMPFRGQDKNMLSGIRLKYLPHKDQLVIVLGLSNCNNNNDDAYQWLLQKSNRTYNNVVFLWTAVLILVKDWRFEVLDG